MTSRLPLAVANVIEALRDERIEARYSFKPMHMQPVFADHPVVGGGSVYTAVQNLLLAARAEGLGICSAGSRKE